MPRDRRHWSGIVRDMEAQMLQYVFWIHLPAGYVEYIVEAETEEEAYALLKARAPDAPKDCVELVSVG